MPDLVSEVDSDRRAARPAGPGLYLALVRARAFGSSGRAHADACCIMSHGRVTIFGGLACIDREIPCMQTCMHDLLPAAWMPATKDTVDRGTAVVAPQLY